MDCMLPLNIKLLPLFQSYHQKVSKIFSSVYQYDDHSASLSRKRDPWLWCHLVGKEFLSEGYLQTEWKNAVVLSFLLLFKIIFLIASDVGKQAIGALGQISFSAVQLERIQQMLEKEKKCRELDWTLDLLWGGACLNSAHPWKGLLA